MVTATVLLLLYHGTFYFIEVTNLRERVNPHAVKGYSYCSINNSELLNYPEKYTCDFNPKPNTEDVLIVTFVNSAWISLAQNWICSAEKVGLKKNLYLIAFEKGVCSKLTNVRCYEYPNANFKRTVFSQPEYQKLVIERTHVILKLLSCGPKIALVDADITFLQNPLKYLAKFTEHKDIVFQADSSRVRFLDAIMPYVFHYICGGFIYMKPNYATRYLWLSVLQYQQNFLWNDQAGLNICIRHYSQTVEWETLDAEYFPNGQQYFSYNQKSNKNMIVHANHLESDEKILRMIASDVWCSTDVAVDMCNASAYQSLCSRHSHSQGATPKWCDAFIGVCEDKYSITIA